MTGEQADLFAEAPARPAGLHYRDDFIEPAEERSLLDAIGALALTEARYKAYTAKRRIASFGSSYDFDANVARDAPPLPALDVRPRSGYVLSGDARWKWQHAVPPVTELRYSITFRTRRR